MGYPTEPPDGPDAREASAEEAPPKKRSRARVWWRWIRRTGKGTAFVLATVLALGLGFLAYLTQTERGQRMVLDFILDRIRGSLAGELTVGEIRSVGLLGGATLYEVELTAANDRPFLVADSIRLQYSPVGLISRSPQLTSATIWGVHLEISKYTEDQPLNVTELLRPRPEGAPPGTRTRIGLGTVRLEGGLVEVLTPVPEGSERPTVPSPVDGSPLSRLALEDLSIVVDDAVVQAGDEDTFTGFLADLTADVYLMEEPLVITGAQGQVAFGEAGLRLSSAALTLPGSRVRGRVDLGPQSPDEEGWGFSADLETEGPADLADLQWLDPRIPDGSATGGVRLSIGEEMTFDLRGVEVELEASTIYADGNVRMLDDGIAMEDLLVRGSPLVLSRLEPWIEMDIPMEGFVSGEATLNGTFDRVRAEGRLTLVPSGYGGRPTTARFDGTFLVGDDPGVVGLTARLDPVNYALLNVIEPGLVPPATGVLVLEADGRVSSGVEFDADVDLRPDAYGDSRFTAVGAIRRNRAGRWIAEIESDLRPLSLDVLNHAMPDAALRGQATGDLSVLGPLDDLEISADLAVGGGRAVVDARLDATNPAGGYRIDARMEDLSVEEITARVPERSDLTGTLLIEGRGFDPATAVVSAQLVSGSSRYGGMRVDTARAFLQIADGLIVFDTIEAALGGFSVEGSGSLGLIGSREGRAVLEFEAESLEGLRSIAMGDTVIAGDTLSALERLVLEGDGVDLGTLPDSAEVAVGGSASGTVEIEGSLEAFDVEGHATLLDARYGRNMVDTAEVTFLARGLPSSAGSMDLTVAARGLSVQGRSFEAVDATVSMSDRSGTAAVDARLGENEQVVAEGDFALDSLWHGTVTLREARAEIDSLTYRMVGTSTITWDANSIGIQELEVTRPGEDPMHLTADGVLRRDGQSDFDLRVEGIHLELATRLAQMDSLDIGGHLDLDVNVTGPAEAPVLRGSMHAHDPRYRTVQLDSISGTLSYDARMATFDLFAWEEGRQVFRTEGDVPVNLALNAPGPVLMDNAPMDVRVYADSLQSEILTAYLTFLEDPQGTVSGDFRVQGTVASPRPSGVLRIEDLSYGIDAIGVRHENVQGTLTLNPEGTVDVDVTAGGDGTARTTGVIDLEPLTNPSLDLDITFTQFQAVDRVDIEGEISGTVDLTGTYTRPVITGSLTVDQGTLFVDEFSRSVGVIDLTDPRLFDQVVDTAALSARPLLASIRNPFLDNLRVDVSLSVPREVWLRSPDMNVEMGGSLEVSYDRRDRDIVLVGELQALRGSYSVLGRSFDVVSGSVGFIGTPGINPTLDIQAVTDVRRGVSSGAPMEITATVSGTLTQPEVTLGTNEAAVSEADLVSYLVFGRPTNDIAGSNAFQNVTGVLAGAGVSLLGAQLGGAIAQNVGLDYVSITQTQAYGFNSLGALAGTQVEIGQYIGEDVFVIVLLRLDGDTPLAGVRAEIALSDTYALEGYYENRYLRSALAAFENVDETRVIGAFIFREWGY